MKSQIPSTGHDPSEGVADSRWRWSMGATAVLLLLFVAAGLWLVSMPATAGSAVEVYGPIVVPTTWSSGTYHVTGTVTIQGNGVLTIAAGVEVRFGQDTALVVETGPLLALGTAGNPVLFTADTTSPPGRGYWSGIYFENTSSPSIIRHSIVEYAKTGVSVGDSDFHTLTDSTFRHNGDSGDWSSGGAVNAVGDELAITNNLVHDNELGLHLHKSFWDLIDGNEIYNNDGFGIGFLAENAPGGDHNTIADNHVHDNGGFGIGLVAQDGNQGGSLNDIVGNHVHDNVAAGTFQGDGLYLDVGAGNLITGNLITGNARHGVWARSQLALQFTDNIVRANGQNGFDCAYPTIDPLAIHDNVLCNNLAYQLDNAQLNPYINAEGNWYGVQTPTLGVEIDGLVDYIPWISMAVAIEPPTLPADGRSTAVVTVTMSSNGYDVPDGYTVTVSASQGDVSPSTLALYDGQGTATYTAGTVPGPVDFEVTDGCATITFSGVLTLSTYLDLAVTKSDGGLIVGPTKDYMVEYTIVVSNVGQMTATNVILTDTLPAEATYTGTTWSCDDGECTYLVGTMLPSDTVQVLLPVELDKSMLDCPIVLTNTIEVQDLADADANPANNIFTLTSIFECLPDLVVVINDNVGGPISAEEAWVFDLLGEDPNAVEQLPCVDVGDWITYSVAYVNAGLITATEVVLTETVPEYTTYQGYGWTCPGDECTLDVGTLPPYIGGIEYFAVQVDAAPPDMVVEDEARIGGAEQDLYPPDNVSYEETLICGPPAPGFLYLPIVMKGALVGPTPSPGPPPGPPPPPTPPPPYISDVDVNPETNRVYVASPRLDAVFAVNPTGAGSIVATIGVGNHPVGLAVVTTTNKIYAANLHSWTLTAIRGSDHTRIKDIYVGAQACKAAADSGKARVYVTNHLETDNGAAAVNSQTDQFQYYYSRLNGTQGRYGIDVDPAQDKLFIAARDAQLIAIQDAFYPDVDPLIVKLSPVRVPYVVAFNPTTQHLFVTAPDDNLVVVLAPYSIEWDQGRWVTWQGRQVFVLDRTNAGWVKEIGVGLGAEEGIDVDPGTGYVFVTNARSDTVSIIQDDPDAANIQWIKDLPVGEYPQGVGVDISTHFVYVGNAESRDITVIDGTALTVTKTIPLY